MSRGSTWSCQGRNPAGPTPAAATLVTGTVCFEVVSLRVERLFCEVAFFPCPKQRTRPEGSDRDRKRATVNVQLGVAIWSHM